MQKKLIALAVVAAFSAPAFADVTAYGVLDAAIAHISNDGQKSDVQAVAGGLSTSRFGVKTVEDLNNGWKAVGVLEYFLDNETNDTVGVTTAGALKARQQMLAVAGDFGTVATGYLQTTGYDFAVKFDPTAGSSVSPLQSMAMGGGNLIGTTTVAARAQRALAYISPDLGGVTVAVNYTTAASLSAATNGNLGNLGLASSAADTKITATLVSATYNGGPLSVGGVYAKASLPSALASSEPKEYALGASYDFGVAKVLGTYQNLKVDLNNFSSKAVSLSVVAPVGPGAVVGTYAKLTTSNAGVSLGGKGMTVAYLQGLSKQTTAYAAIEKITNNSNTVGLSVDNNALSSVATGGGSSTLIAVGLKKVF